MIFAGDVKIDPTLRANLGGNNSLGSTAKTNINKTYADAQAQLDADARARGVKPGSYATSRLGSALGLSQQGLQTGLEGALGDAAYTNFKADRGYNENMALAQQIGALNKPKTLEEVLGALGLAGKVGGAAYGAYTSTPRPGQSYGSNSLTLGPYSGYQPNMASYPPPYDPYAGGY